MTIEHPHVEKEVQLWVGPQHPGVTGNMAIQIWVSGDEIQRGMTHVGYLHRGFEKLMERRSFIQSHPIVCRMCVAEPDTTEYLISAGLEELSGLEVPQRAKWLRMMNMEMARIGSLLHQIGGVAGGTGLGIVGTWMYVLRDYMLDRFEELSGARVYHMYSTIGGVRRDLPEGFAERMEGTLKQIEERLPFVDNLLFDSFIWQQRTQGISVIPKDIIDSYGITGPAARACGVKKDTRRDFPYLAYDDLEFETITAEAGDIFDRAWVRRQEIQQGCNLIRAILKRLETIDGPHMCKLPNMLTWRIPKGQTYVRAESSRGEMGYYIVTDGSEKMRRIHLRGASYTLAFPVLERHLLPGMNISDLHTTLVSLPTCPPELER